MGVQPRQEHRELLAAVPRRDVALADARRQQVGECPEGLVAGWVAVSIVEVLEMIEVEQLVDQVTAASGGPATYTGRGMRETHDGMGVTAGEFDALVADLVTTLDAFSVPAAEQRELLGILGPLRSDIVEVETPATGTPLPDSYQNAPPLVRV